MIGFAGLSHLGIVSAVAAAARGFQVVAYHPDAGLCEQLARGRLPIVEPGLTDLLGSNWPSLRFTAEARDLAACPLVFCSLDVATGANNECDLDPLEYLLDTATRAAAPATTWVLLNQVPPGFTRRWEERLR